MTYGSESECAIHYTTAPHLCIYVDQTLVYIGLRVFFPLDILYMQTQASWWRAYEIDEKHDRSTHDQRTIDVPEIYVIEV